MKSEGAEPRRGETKFIDRLRGSPPDERRRLLVQFLREQFAALLAVEPQGIAIKDNLIDLGVDSLKAVELKTLIESHMGLQLSSSLLFDYPNLDALAGFLLKQTFTSPSQPTSPACQSQLAVDLSQASLAELLAAELEEIT